VAAVTPIRGREEARQAHAGDEMQEASQIVRRGPT
jgi:hypothetical protein